MTADPLVHIGTDEFRGATFRECDLRGLRILGSTVDDVDIWAFGGELGSVRIEGVEVGTYVSDELDRRFPERVALRELISADDHRAAWRTVTAAWDETRTRAEALPEQHRHEQVDGEWSTAQTLRHLIFAMDLWLGRMIEDRESPFHVLGLPPGDPSEEAAELGLTPDAQPEWDVVGEVHRERCQQVTEALDNLKDEDLATERTIVPIHAWGEQSFTVGTCLWIIYKEHAEHRRYAERDLSLHSQRA